MFESPWLWGNSYRAFSFPKERKKQRICWCTRAILWELNFFSMITLSSHVGFMLHILSTEIPPLNYSAESSEEKRVHNM